MLTCGRKRSNAREHAQGNDRLRNGGGLPSGADLPNGTRARPDVGGTKWPGVRIH
jgi:hypothetical protein